MRFKFLRKRFTKSDLTEQPENRQDGISQQEILDALVRTAEEMRPLLRVTQRRICSDARGYELVLTKGMDSETVFIPFNLAYDWLEKGDRTKEAEIRRLVIQTVDRMDLRASDMNEKLGFWDWTGEEKPK